MKHRMIYAGVLLYTAIALLLTACGGGSEPTQFETRTAGTQPVDCGGGITCR